MSKELDELRFAIDVAARYHQRRRGFYMFLDRLVKGLSVLAGSAAALTVAQKITGATGGDWLILVAAFGIAILNAWDLVLGFPNQARDHEDLRRRYVQLQADIVAVGGLDDGKIAGWKSKYLAIVADETPTFWAVYAQCWNQVIIATRRPDGYLRKLPSWKLYPGYIFRMHERSFPTLSGREG